MKNRFALSAACLIAAAAFSSPQVANAQCTTASLSGVYGFNRVGVLTNSPLKQYSFDGGISIFAAVGQFTADGAGHFTSLTENISVNGVVYQNDQVFAPSALAYTINSDCTGTLTIRSSILPTSVDYDFVFENKNTVLRFVGSDQSTEALGKAVLLGPVASCPAGLATLNGAFGGSSFGLLFISGFGLFIDTSEGRYSFDGVGGLSVAHFTEATNAAVSRWFSSNGGKYTVNSDCTGTLTVAGFLFPTVDFVLVNGGNSMLTINIGSILGLQADIGELISQ